MALWEGRHKYQDPSEQWDNVEGLLGSFDIRIIEWSWDIEAIGPSQYS